MVKTQQRVKQRHVPERTCIACHTQRPKQALVRVVHTPTGEVKIDETGKQNGRGAYLCKQVACWEQALKRGALNKALRITLTQETTDALLAYAATLVPASDEGKGPGEDLGIE